MSAPTPPLTALDLLRACRMGAFRLWALVTVRLVSARARGPGAAWGLLDLDGVLVKVTITMRPVARRPRGAP